MAQIALYIDDPLLRKMDMVSKKEKKSRSLWVKEAIMEKLESELPQSWFKLWGSWEDNRSMDEILADIRSGYVKEARKRLK